MLGFLTLMAVALCGYVHGPVWVVAPGALALASLSYARHIRVYERGQELGQIALLNSALTKGLALSAGAAAISYSAGLLLRTLSGL
jgi:hypothetical protein